VKKVDLGGIALEYEVTGDGEPVVFIHGALIADSFRPMLEDPAFADRFRCITYHRRGYEASTPSPQPATIADQADDCRALLGALQIERAHVVGHSFGGVIALKLAMDTPQLVRSLAVLEPALVLGVNGAGYRAAMARNRDRYRGGDVEGTVDEFLRARFGPIYREYVERNLPGALEQAVRNAGNAFEVDMPPLADFGFSEREARTITQPVLVVLGAESNTLWPRFGETHRALLAWLPHAESYVLPQATHALQLQNPRDMAVALAGFLSRNQMRRS
jgi:pimeloyl-ACP methyl ester carboxylesterase